MKQADLVVVGGGIIGLATCYQVLLKNPKLKVFLLEKEKTIASHQTGNNSGVIHSGIYYKPGSLKAKNCVNGVQRLLDFCQKHSIPYDLCGKLIVATKEEELSRLEELFRRGNANGVKDLKLLGQKELRKIEPYSNGIKAIHAPNTGIIDYKLVAKVLHDEILKMGGQIYLGEEVLDIKEQNNEVITKTKNLEICSKNLVNCSGLHADTIAKKTDNSIKEKIVPFRGEYYFLSKEKAPLLKGLIYPVPNPKFPFLGVHLTKRISGEVEAGPNAVLAFAKEGYKKGNINLKDMGRYMGYSGFWSMAMRNWKVGLYEMYRSFSKAAFVKDIQRLMPDIKEEDLISGGAGVRAQVIKPNGQMVDDFLIYSSSNIINVLNAPSPGATSCLSIGNYISSKVSTRAMASI